jgi:ubiquitin carboxyl-terminal hydrolase 22/27/51
MMNYELIVWTYIQVQAPTCGTCQKTLHRPFVCMECSFAGCWRGDHGVGHLKEAGHPFCEWWGMTEDCFFLRFQTFTLIGVDVTSGAIFCKECDDFVHNSTLERLVESISLSREEIGTPFQGAVSPR